MTATTAIRRSRCRISPRPIPIARRTGARRSGTPPPTTSSVAFVRRTHPAGADGRRTVTHNTFYSDYLTAQQTLAAGSDQSYVRTFHYDMFLNERQLVSVVVQSDNNATTTIGHDPLGQVISSTSPPTAADPSGDHCPL